MVTIFYFPFVVLNFSCMIYLVVLYLKRPDCSIFCGERHKLKLCRSFFLGVRGIFSPARRRRVANLQWVGGWEHQNFRRKGAGQRGQPPPNFRLVVPQSPPFKGGYLNLRTGTNLRAQPPNPQRKRAKRNRQKDGRSEGGGGELEQKLYFCLFPKCKVRRMSPPNERAAPRRENYKKPRKAGGGRASENLQ